MGRNQILFNVEFNGHKYTGLGEVTSTRTYATEHVYIIEDDYDQVGYGKDKWMNRPWYRFKFGNALEDAVVSWFGKQAADKIHRAVNSSSNCQEAMDKFFDGWGGKGDRAVREACNRRKVKEACGKRGKVREAWDDEKVTMHIEDLNINDIMKLRSEIVLGSFFYRDYENSFGIDEHEVCDFFDGFLDYAWDEYKNRHGKEAKDIGDIYDEFDNKGEIVDYFDMYKHGYFG